MLTICAWCNRKIEAGAFPNKRDQPVSHGICKKCSQKILTGTPTSLVSFLNSLEGPVLLVDKEGRMLVGNDQACKALGKEADEIAGKLGGELIECIHAKQKGGCGGTIHCKSCTIRNTVMDTLHTGKSHSGVEAYPDLHEFKGDKVVRFTISTEKIGEVVMLQIVDMKEVDNDKKSVA